MKRYYYEWLLIHLIAALELLVFQLGRDVMDRFILWLSLLVWQTFQSVGDQHSLGGAQFEQHGSHGSYCWPLDPESWKELFVTRPQVSCASTISRRVLLYCYSNWLISSMLCSSVESNQLSSSAIVRIIKSLLVQKSIEEFRASNQVLTTTSPVIGHQ